MIRARREFLDRGHYRPVIEAVAAAVGDADVVVDAGCGEGTYLAAVAAPTRIGVDVSKPAIRLAAKRWPTADFAVASSHRLPLADASVDTVMSVFAPRPFDEFRRVLRPGGRIVTASPGPDHLMELRASLYDSPRPHAPRAHAAPGAADVRRVRFELGLDSGDAAMLLQMTPYWWTASSELQRTVAPPTLTVDILVAIEPG